MLSRLSFLPLLIAFQAFGALPNLVCRENNYTVTLEEGIDEYFIDVTERASTTLLASSLLGAWDYREYSLQFAIPKVTDEQGTSSPSCAFSTLLPQIYRCQNRLSRPIKITRLEEGVIKIVPAETLQVLAKQSTTLRAETTRFTKPLQQIEIQITVDKGLPSEKPVAAYRFNAGFCESVASPNTPAR
jgi:hypothetical protein